jgi:uncharacterized OB-fold protein
MSGAFDPRLCEDLREALAHHGDATSREFYARLRARTLCTTRCDACGALAFPPRPVCAVCARASVQSGGALRWVELSGRGRLHAFSQNDRALFFRKPDVIGLVDLEEGCGRILSRIAAPFESLRIGQALRVEYIELPGGLVLHQFRPDGEG